MNPNEPFEIGDRRIFYRLVRTTAPISIILEKETGIIVAKRGLLRVAEGTDGHFLVLSGWYQGAVHCVEHNLLGGRFHNFHEEPFVNENDCPLRKCQDNNEDIFKWLGREVRYRWSLRAITEKRVDSQGKKHDWVSTNISFENVKDAIYFKLSF